MKGESSMKKRVLAFFLMMLLIATLCTGVSASGPVDNESIGSKQAYFIVIDGEPYSYSPYIIVGYNHNVTGYHVGLVQRALNNVNYYHPEADCYSGKSIPDEIFGPDTYEAVKKFQSFCGLTADGMVGTDTWSAFESWCH